MINKPKGTYDLYGRDSIIYNYALEVFSGICGLNNYSYIKTPTFESTSLFHRSVGETSDIVSKETYDFKDRGDREMTLRPEGTAGIVRSVIENKLYANTNNYLKYYYNGPMFRYERPQAGRFREFNQFGVEVFGTPSPYIDAEVINLGVKYFGALGLQKIKIKINNLGTKEDRQKYRDVLCDYMKKYESELCDDCKIRLEKNPLRILDCKVDGDKEFFKNAPLIQDYLSEESEKYFAELLENLSLLDIDFELDSNLVRGLDYYDYAVFEFISEDEKLRGASTICAGGRYNNLVKSLGGPELPGVGFALGYERIAEIIKSLELEPKVPTIDIYVAPVSKNELSDAFVIGTNLKDAGFSVEIDYRETNIKNKLSSANKMGVSYIVIVGEEELKKASVILKDALTKEEKVIRISNLADELYVNF